jgi:S-adenosylmethionine hydrolase
VESHLNTLALMTDFGTSDTYVGAMKAVISSRCHCHIIDITHEIPPGDIVRAAYFMGTIYRFLPSDSVAVCVVDPGVGTDRRGLAVRWPGGYFVGPDNGWLSSVIRECSGRDIDEGSMSLPEGWRAVALDNPGHWLPKVSRTFHGRDIFAPVAAALVTGVPLEALGQEVDSLVSITVHRPADKDGSIHGHVIHVDRFGNLITDIPEAFLSDRFTVAVGGGIVDGPAKSYQNADPVIAIVGSSGCLEIAAPNGSAARLIMVAVGAEVVVTSRRTGDSPEGAAG